MRLDKLIDLSSDSVNKTINILLKDRTTGHNIIFATEAYEKINFTDNITKKKLACIDLQPRVSKTLAEKTSRTRKNAEVFTPSWICNKMNNHCDEEWFGRKNVFNTEQEQDWIITEDKVEFPKGKTWKDYVDSTRLEITCGEAPYLVSRYDTVTGEIIPIEKRIGILDRKLRVINENAKTQQTWTQWVFRAFESVYGYEYQGDNLLIARINLLETFYEYTIARWGIKPSDSAIKRVATIISWNLWQMDGIQGVVPYISSGCKKENAYEPIQLSLFELLESDDESEKETELASESPETIDCKIYNWREEKSFTYKSMRKE